MSDQLDYCKITKSAVLVDRVKQDCFDQALKMNISSVESYIVPIICPKSWTPVGTESD